MNKKRVFALVLAALMVVSQLPTAAFADELTCTQQELCADGAHVEGCALYVAAEEPTAADNAEENPAPAANAEEEPAPAANAEKEPEVQTCTTEGCTYAEGHEGNCSNFVQCATEGCTYAEGHEGNCSNFVQCATEGCTYAEGHEGNCSNFVQCTTEGCTYAEGHEGNCSNFVQCATEGCTLNQGHEGGCNNPTEPTKSAQEVLDEMITALPTPETVELMDETQREAFHNDRLVPIYTYAAENGINLDGDPTLAAINTALNSEMPIPDSGVVVAKIGENGYATLAEAFAAVNGTEGSDTVTLTILAGTHSPSANGQLQIKRGNVVIQGESGAVIDCAGFTVDGQAGVYLGASNVTMKNLTVTATSGDAVKVSHLDVEGTLLSGVSLSDLTLTSTGGHGLNIHGVSSAAVAGVNATGSKCGISLANAQGVTISGTQATGSWASIGMMYGTGNAYANAVSLTLGAGNTLGVVYSERPAAAAGVDTVHLTAAQTGMTFAAKEFKLTAAEGVALPTTSVVATIGDVSYGTLADAIDGAVDGATILVVANEIELPIIKKAGLIFKTTVGTKVTNAFNTNSDSGWSIERSTFDGFEFKDQAAFIGKDLTIKNCKFTGNNGLYYGCASGTWTIENCEFATQIYGLGVGESPDLNAVVNVKNCTFYGGFNTFGQTMKLNFTGCTFKKGSYNVLQTIDRMMLSNCTFEADWPTGANGGHVGNNGADAVTEIYNTTYAGGTLFELQETDNKNTGIFVVNPTKNSSGLYTGGTFASKPADDLLAEGYGATQLEDGTYIVGIKVVIGDKVVTNSAEEIVKEAVAENKPITMPATSTATNTIPANLVQEAASSNAALEIEVPVVVAGKGTASVALNKEVLSNANGEISITVEPATAAEGETKNTFEITYKVDGKETELKGEATVTLPITGLTDPVVYYVTNGAKSYLPKSAIVDNGDDGITYTTTHFSEWGAEEASEVGDFVASVGSNNYTSLQAAIDAAGSGDEVKLLADVVVDAPIDVSKKITLDLNKYKISNTTAIWEKDDAKEDSALIMVKSGNLTLTGNGTLEARKGDCYAIDVLNNGAVTVEDGTIIGNVSAIQVNSGSAVINGGSFSQHQDNYDGTYLINCVDENYKNGNATVTITGGSFKGFNPACNKAEGVHTHDFVSGKVGELGEDGFYTLKDGTYVAKVGEKCVTDLQVAINGCLNGGTVTLRTDTKQDVTVDKHLTLDFAGNKYSGEITLNEGAEVTIANKGSGTLEINSANKLGYTGKVVSNEDGTQYWPVWTLNAPKSVAVSANDTSVKVGTQVTLTAAEATHELKEGVTYTYQWYNADGVIQGATGETYTFNAPSSAGSYNYYCQVTAKHGDNTSDKSTKSNEITIQTSANEGEIEIKDKPEGGLTATYGSMNSSSFTLSYSQNSGSTVSAKVVDEDGKVSNIATVTLGSVDGWENGTATVTVKGAGTATIILYTEATNEYTAAEDSIKLTVEKGDTIVRGQEEKASGTYGETITLSAYVGSTIKTRAARTTNPTVTFKYGDVVLGSEDVTDVQLNGGKWVSIDYDTKDLTLPVGKTSEVTVEYSGSVNLNESTSTIQVTVDKKELTVLNPAATNRAYDGTTIVTVTGSLDPDELVTPTDGEKDKVTLTALSGTMANADAGENKAVTVTAKLEGAQADRYSVKGITGVTVDITKANAPEGYVSFPKETVNKAVGDNPFFMEATAEGATLTYSSGDEDVAVVDPATGKVTIKGAGKVTITATATSKNYKDATASYTLTVGYAIIKGAGQTVVRGNSASFTSNAPFGKFVRVEVDGKKLDNEHFESKSGSTVITLKASFVETLSSRVEHTLTIVSQDGEASTTFTVKRASYSGSDDKNYDSDGYATGDITNTGMWLALVAIGVVGILASLLGKKFLAKRK